MSTRALLFSFLLMTTFKPSAFAGEHGEEKGGGHEEAAHGEGEKKAEGHGEEKSVSAPWVEVENQIQELYSKIKMKESTILHLLEEKDHMPDNSPLLHQAVKEIVQEHRELRHLVEEYDKKVSILKYRFPERNSKQLRTYDRVEVKSIDDMEKALGIDGKLSRNMKRMRNTYEPESKPVAQEPVAAKPEPAVKKEPSIEDAHSIILQK
jgi:hypothetical protein